jgi:4-hydroxy-tetrahydrodipicolinate synthase
VIGLFGCLSAEKEVHVFDGLMVAMVTPFREGELDLEGVARITDFMIEGGVEGLVVSGSTGEAATTTLDERRTLWRFVRERVGGRIPVVAGTGTNNTAESIALTRMAEELGLDGAMIVTPYYNKPTPRGQVQHFQAIARSTKLPLILYNVPGRTGTNTLPETLEKVGDLANVVAVKEASGSLDQASAIKARTGLTLLSGDDSLTLPMIAIGATGVISVAGNAAPAEMRALTDHARAGRVAEAARVHQRLLPLFKALFMESNPGPVKYLMSAMKLIENEVRLPLVPVEPASEPVILAAARECGIELEPAARETRQSLPARG